VASNEWRTCSSRAVAAFRYLPTEGVLQVRFVKGRMTYDYPCDDRLFMAFETASSKGRFVNDVLKPHAEALGWSVKRYRW
jgi:KTSC domain